MNHLITGGAGFIGSHLADLLSEDENNNIIVLDNLEVGQQRNIPNKQNITFIHCDISTQYGILKKAFKNIDFVYHLAARADVVPSIELPERYFDVNVKGTINVLEAARENNVKGLIYAASSSCYGIPTKFPTPEDSAIKPMYPYALTKRLGEELVLHWEKVYGIRALSLRFFNVYGTRARTSGTYGAVFGVFLAQKLAGKPFTIVGDGEQTRDFTYVTDVANAIKTVLQEGKSGHIYNVGSGKTISINKFVELIGGPSVNIPKRPGEPDITFADIKKITSETSWRPKITIDEGVAIMLKNISYWADAPVWDAESISQETKSWFKYLS